MGRASSRMGLPPSTSTCEIPECRHPTRRRYPDIQYERRGIAKAVLTASLQGCAMAHAGNGIFLDYFIAIGVAPDLARLSIDRLCSISASRCPVNALPLGDEGVSVGRRHRLIGCSLPDRNLRPVPLMG